MNYPSLSTHFTSLFYLLWAVPYFRGVIYLNEIMARIFKIEQSYFSLHQNFITTRYSSVTSELFMISRLLYYLGRDSEMANKALTEAVRAFTTVCPTFKTNCDFEFVDAFHKLISLLHCGLSLLTQSSTRMVAVQLASGSGQSKGKDEPVLNQPVRLEPSNGFEQNSAVFDAISGVVERTKFCVDCHKKTIVKEPIISLDFVVLFNSDIPPIRKTFKDWRFDEGLKTLKITSQKWKLIPFIKEKKEVIVSSIYDYLSHFNTSPGVESK